MAHETNSLPFPSNRNKYLVVKHYDDGHYYYNVYNYSFTPDGRYRGYSYKKFIRTNLRWLKLLGVM